MPQYQVPQFIDTENKLVGPLTFRQSIYVGIGVAIILISQYIVSYNVFIVIAITIGSISVALAFLKIDDIPLPNYIGRSVTYLIGIKQYTYQNNDNQDILKQITKQ
jgi:hypothetical protein